MRIQGRGLAMASLGVLACLHFRSRLAFEENSRCFS